MIACLLVITAARRIQTAAGAFLAAKGKREAAFSRHDLEIAKF